MLKITEDLANQYLQGFPTIVESSCGGYEVPKATAKQAASTK